MDVFSEKYNIIQILGSQRKRKFGEVYLIESKKSKEKFVLKKAIKTDFNTYLINQLRAESQFNFASKQLPRTIDFFENDKELLLIRTFNHGVSLDEFWKDVKRKDQIDILKEIVKSLKVPIDELREREIVHCDLKPSNIIINRSNHQLEASIIDFGLAIESNNIPSRKTLFSLGYAAPELILNELTCINHSTDLFSIGLIIWRLFTNEIPLSHSNPSIMTNLQITHPIQNHSKIPNQLMVIISKMCYKHNFKLPPNKYSKTELKEFLNLASSRRYNNLDEIIKELDFLKTEKSLWKRLF